MHVTEFTYYASDIAMKSSIRELWGRKIILPPLVRVMVAAAIFLFVGYCTFFIVEQNRHDAARMEGMKKLRDKAEQDPYWSKRLKESSE